MTEAEAITAALSVTGLTESDRSSVEYYLHDSGQAWRECCGGSCMPCSLVLARAVDAARHRLGIRPATGAR